MARAIEQIERDIAALSEAVKAIAAELGSVYTSYLIALGQAVRAQLILASYQICTQGYPKQFLSLSVSQRQQLQQAISKLGKNAAEQLINQLKSKAEEAEEAGEAEGQRGKGHRDKEIISNFNLACLSNPIELVQWQHNMEQAIAHTLKTFSLETNRLLQQAGILSQKLPSPLLEAATAAPDAADLAAGAPNLMNLLIETENPTDSEETSMTQLIAIQLRLSEIEFTDANVRAARNQIRQLENRVNLLGREYQKKQRERTIAEAEAAWRSSWFEE
jgi:hypothetical protein